MFIFDKGSLTGVDIGSYAIKAIKIKGAGASKTLSRVAYSRLDHIAIPEESSKLSEILKNVFNANRIKAKKVVTVFSGGSLTLAHLFLPKMPKRDMKDAVRWEMRKHIAFPAEDLVCDYTTIGEVKRGEDFVNSVLVFGVRKRDIEQLIKIFEDALLEPSSIDVTPIAMLAAFNHNNVWEKGVSYSMIDIGNSKSTVAIFKDKKLMFTREIPIGGKELTMIVMENLACTEEVAEKEKIRCGVLQGSEKDTLITTAIFGVLERLAAEVNRSFDYYQAQFREESVSKLFLCGGTAKLKGIEDMFTHSLGVSCFVDDPLRNIKIESKKFELSRIKEFAPDMTVAVGLAL